jgi:hypothetical protein
MFKVGDYVVIANTNAFVSYELHGQIGVITRISNFVDASVGFNIWIGQYQKDYAYLVNKSSLRAASDSEILAYRLGVPHTIGKQQSIPATACSKAGSNVSVIQSQ